MPTPEPEKKRKVPQITARLGGPLQKRFDDACSLTGLSATSVVQAFAEAFCEQVEEQGGIWLPLKVVPKKSVPSASAQDAPPRSTGSIAKARITYPKGEESLGRGRDDLTLASEKSHSSKKHR